MDSSVLRRQPSVLHRQPRSHSLGGPSPPAQWTSPVTLLRNEGQEKQIKKPTSWFTTGHSTLSFFIRLIAFALATPFNPPVTALGIFFGFSAWKTFTKNLVSDAIPLLGNRLSIKI